MKNDYNTSAEKISNPSVSAEEHLKLMADYAPVMMWIAGLNKGYNYLNNGWQNFTGKTIEEGIGDGWSKLIHPDDVQKKHPCHPDERLLTSPTPRPGRRP